MDRRKFLRMACGGIALGTTGCGLESDTLESACKDGANRLGIDWSDTVARRVKEEMDEIALTGAGDSLIRCADGIRRLHAEGVRIAPGWGSTPSSLVAYLTGITSINSLDFGLTPNVVRGSKKRTLDLCLALDAHKLGRLVAVLKPDHIASRDIFPDYPQALDCSIGNLNLWVFPVAVPQRKPPTKADEMRPWALEAPFSAFLDAFAPRDVNEVALAITLFRLGPVLSGISQRVLESRARLRAMGEFGPGTSWGHLVFREDAIAAVMENTGCARPIAAQFTRIAGWRCHKEIAEVRENLLRHTVKANLSPDRASRLLDHLTTYSGYMHQRAHAVSMAHALRGRDPVLRECVLADNTAWFLDERRWAWSVVEMARRCYVHPSTR